MFKISSPSYNLIEESKLMSSFFWKGYSISSSVIANKILMYKYLGMPLNFPAKVTPSLPFSSTQGFNHYPYKFSKFFESVLTSVKLLSHWNLTSFIDCKDTYLCARISIGTCCHIKSKPLLQSIHYMYTEILYFCTVDFTVWYWKLPR